MEVHFAPDVATRLEQVALSSGRDVEQLVKDTIVRMLDDQVRFLAGVQRGMVQADHGEFVEHDEVVQRVDRVLVWDGRGGGTA